MSKTTRILLALAIGLAIGIALASIRPTWVPGAIAVAQPTGTALPTGLKMTTVPLVVALLVTAIAATAEASCAGRMYARAPRGYARGRGRASKMVELVEMACYSN